MAGIRGVQWQGGWKVYTASQVASVLNKIGLDIDSDTDTHFQVMCPYHSNHNDPAMAVDKTKGLYHCFNPSCARSGNLHDLVMFVKKVGYFPAIRLIDNSASDNFSNDFKEMMVDDSPLPSFPQDSLDRMFENFAGSQGESYLMSRGFNKETLEYFRIGYSEKKNMVTVPMHDDKGEPVGIIGRSASHEDKSFKNSVGLPKKRTAWNFHRAKRSSTVIITEASFDAMRIFQAGHRGAVALLGGSLSANHIEQIGRTFTEVIIFTDFDNKMLKASCRVCKGKRLITCEGHRPGRDLGRQIVEAFPEKSVRWACYSNNEVYPHNAKDAMDLTDEEISQCIENSLSPFEYDFWSVEECTSGRSVV